MVSLADYRQRHAQYKRDRDLQDLHAKYPWIVTWDDHEITNDGWADGAENHDPATEGGYAARRTQAHRAFDEWMPTRLEGTARVGDGDKLYRRFRFGKLAEISMLDLRNYRSEQVRTALPSPVPAPEQEVSDPNRTITGRQQMEWLKTSLSNNRAQWKVIGNPVMIAPVNFGPVPRRRPRQRQRRHRAAALTTASPTTSTSGTATRRTAARCSGTSATTRSTTPCSSPATSTRDGPQSCRTTPRRTRTATRPASSSCARR